MRLNIKRGRIGTDGRDVISGCFAKSLDQDWRLDDVFPIPARERRKKLKTLALGIHSDLETEHTTRTHRLKSRKREVKSVLT